jgi:hypothetical protein
MRAGPPGQSPQHLSMKSAPLHAFSRVKERGFFKKIGVGRIDHLAGPPFVPFEHEHEDEDEKDMLLMPWPAVLLA